MVIENNIDYNKLFHSLTYYKSKGFKYSDLNWLVDEKISNITKPTSHENFSIKKDVLVASAEQSFLDLLFNDKLIKDRYVGITPCFRDDIIDDLHNLYFMKVELIDIFDVSEQSLLEIIDISLEFFNKYLKCEIIQIDDNSYDIIDSKNKLELGSYGIRKYNNYKWIYATGCAEPRLSKILLFQ